MSVSSAIGVGEEAVIETRTTSDTANCREVRLQRGPLLVVEVVAV